MTAITAKVQSVIENTFIKAFESLMRDGSSFISDLYVQADNDTGELQVYDDAEELLGKVVIFDWIKNHDDVDTFNKKVAATLKAVLTVLSSKGIFDKECFLKPFSVSLTDESFVIIEELLFLDDDTFRLDDPLLKDLDTELDNFLDQLLSDV